MSGGNLMVRSVVILAIGALFTIDAKVALADVPDSINYSGILTTSGGSPVINGPYNVTFRIYDEASGLDPALWTETKSVSTVDGLFTTFLGSVTPLPHSVFSGPNRFLGISVEADPEMMPRTAIVAVPYAYRIATVEGATGGSINGDVAISGGHINLDPSSGISGNILKNGIPFIHDFGTSNTFVGVNAGNLSTTGANNTASGAGALANNTTGGDNTANGKGALASNTGGGSNTALGLAALNSNTTGSYNSAIGRNALFHNTTGDSNSAVGGNALFANTSGFSNSANGIDALQNNTTGSRNTANGNNALFSNTTGTLNTASGASALRANTTGDLNTACGASALLRNTTGTGNTACGAAALQLNTFGSNNTAAGYFVLSNNTTGFSNSALGRNALSQNTTGFENTANGDIALESNTTGNSNTASGISALRSNTTGNNCTASGSYALDNNTTGSNNTASGVSALLSNTSGSNNTAVGYGADVSTGAQTNATAIGNGAVVNASNKIRLGNAAVTVLECQVALTVVSDSSQKENVRAVDGDAVLRKLRDLNVSSWNYKGHNPEQFRHYGPMAQEFYSAFGNDGVGRCGDSTTINSGDMAGILMIAVQALGEDNAELRARIEALEKKLERHTP